MIICMRDENRIEIEMKKIFKAISLAYFKFT